MVNSLYSTPPDPTDPSVDITQAPQSSTTLGQKPVYAADMGDYDPATCALIGDWIAKIEDAEEFWKKPFKQMKTNTELAAKGADKKWIEDGCYRVPILNRHINVSVAMLYARNPKASVTRRRQMMYTLWDGRQDSLQSAMQSAAETADPNAIAIVQEVMTAVQKDLMLDRMAKTLEIAWEYYLNQQSANYKQQIKSLVRRVKVCGVGYFKLVFQRALKLQPEITAKIEDTTSKLAEIARLQQAKKEGDFEATDAEAAKLKSLLEDLKQQQYIVVSEGPVLDFPKPHEVLIDPEVVHLKSLAGATWIAFIYEKTLEEIEKLYGVNLGKNFTQFVDEGNRKAPISAKAGKTKAKKVRIYEIWDKDAEQKLTVCRGYDDFLEAPASPKPQTSRFWPLFPVVFNEIEHDDQVIPPSDIEQGKDIQQEYNRSREGLRQHRIAARPYYVEGGRLSDSDRAKLANHLDHEVLTVTALAAGEDINKLLMRGPTAPIDPNLYDVEIHYKDLQRVVGTQEADLGGPASDTATGVSVAENSRSSSNSDNVDDLDEALTDLSRAAGEMMLLELTKNTIIEIVGPGAVWPDHPESRTDASRNLLLEIEAGSSGRPNQAAELAKLERATPMLLQLPGLNPAPLAKRYAELLDLDFEDVVAEGAPSITTINAMMAKQAQQMGQAAQGAQPPGAPIPQPGTGDPATDPNAQGPQGGSNIAVQPLPAPGPQPAYTPPTPY
jgi:hypothetical protein